MGIEKIMKENAEIYITKELIPAVLGKGGANIKKLKEESGATFDIVREGVPYVKIRGDEEAVIKGKKVLNEFIDEFNTNNHMLQLDVTPEEYGTVLGKGGSRIKEIEEKANVNIELLRDKQKVQIRGNPSQVVHARGLIVKHLERRNSAESVGSSSSLDDSVDNGRSKTEKALIKDTSVSSNNSLFNWAHEAQLPSQTSTLMATTGTNSNKKKKKNKKKNGSKDHVNPDATNENILKEEINGVSLVDDKKKTPSIMARH